MATLNPEQQQRIAHLRAKQLDGSITLEELKEGIAIMRQGRMTALASSDSARKRKAVAAIPDADDMLKELEGLK